MQKYLARRLLLAIPTLFFVAVVTFTLMRLVPGDVMMAQVAEMGQYDEAKLAQMRRSLGLDDPIHVQFVKWVAGVARLDFGRSLKTNAATMDEFLKGLRITAELGIMSIVLGVLIAIPIGVISAVRQDTAADYIGRLISIGGISLPSFWLGIMAVTFPAIWWHYQAPMGYRSPFTEPWENFQQFLIPAIIMGFNLSAITMRMTRATMLEVLREDYVRTAYSKGLIERVVIYRHVLKNALIPVVTIIGTQLSFILGGTIIMENLFNLAGVGQLTYNAIMERDYTQVQTNVMLLAVSVVIGNLITDLSYGWLDPRIRYQ